MPTGYTAPVQKGEVTDLADFALTVARGWGALIMLRDSDQSLEATKRLIAEGAYLQHSDYHERELASARARLDELEAMTDEEALAAARAEADRVAASNREYEERAATERARYEAMLLKVEAWEPPTAEHVTFKEYMLAQLRESINFDCRPFSLPIPEVSADWRDREIDRQRERIERAEKEMVAERERNAARQEWVEALLASLEPVPA